jgi:RNA polymerase sigma-70 factor (ECF subfamily)
MGGARPEWEALETAFADHRGQIYRFLLRRTRNHHEAEELTGRVFLEAAEALAGASGEPRSLLAWLYTVAERRFIDEVRRKDTARKRLALAAASPPEETVYSRQVSVALRTAIEELPAEQRDIVIRRVIRGQKFSEIAADIGVSVPACKMRLSRAVAQIRATLEQQDLRTDA